MKYLKYPVKLLKRACLLVLSVVGSVLSKYVPKQNNLIILEGSDDQRYNENSRYLFEYLSKQNDLEVYWFTSNAAVRDHVRSLGYKPLYGILEKLMIMPKAKMVIGTGSSPLNFLNTIGNGAIKICLMHGIGPKASVYTGESELPTMRELENIHKFDYLNFTSAYTSELIGKLAYKTPYKKIIIFGYPRNDQYFDKQKCEDLLKLKTKARQIFPQMPKDAKLLLYSPTWRKDRSRELPIARLKGFDLDAFNDFLVQNGFYMICTIHPNVASGMNVNRSNIFVVDYIKDPLFDINSLMTEADVLINDYSTTSTDFALLDRPQIFVMPDYDEYVKKDCFTEDYRSILPGKEVFSFDELKQTIIDRQHSSEKFRENRKTFLKKYYDASLANSCELHAQFIRKVLGI